MASAAEKIAELLGITDPKAPAPSSGFNVPNMSTGGPIGTAAAQVAQDPGSINPADAGNMLVDRQAELQKIVDSLNDPRTLMANYISGLRGTEFGNVNEDVVRGNKDYNLNGMSAARTMRLAKLADMLNNRVYKSPTKTSNVNVLFGGGMTGDFGNIGTPYQMPKITTEEMRQRETMRETEKERRSADEARRQDVMSEVWRTNRIVALERLARQGKISDIELEELQALRYEEIRQRWSAPYDRKWRVTEQEINDWRQQFGIPSHIANQLTPLLNKGQLIEAGILGTIYGKLSVTPSALQIISQQLTQPILSAIQHGASAPEITKMITDMTMSMKDAIPGITSATN